MADQALKTYHVHARGVKSTIHYTVHAERVDSDRAFVRFYRGDECEAEFPTEQIIGYQRKRQSGE